MKTELKTLKGLKGKYAFYNEETEDDLFNNLKEIIKQMKKEIFDVNKKLDLHNVDECECCEKNWKCVYEIVQIIDKFLEEDLNPRK